MVLADIVLTGAQSAMEQRVEISLQQGTMVASADPAPQSVDVWQWRWKNKGDRDTNSHEITTVSGDRLTDLKSFAGKEVQARLKRGQKTFDSQFRLIPLEPTPEVKPPWPKTFALAALAGAIIATIALAFAARVWTRLRESTAQASTIEALPGQMAWPLLAIGWVVLAIGLWMVLVEWRVTFAYTQASPAATKSPDLVKVLDTLGKLKGATLVTLVGLVILLSPAWIAGSAAEGGSGGGSSDDAATTTAP